MKTTNATNTQKLNTIVAAAKRNRIEARRFDPAAITEADEERLKTENITQAQTQLLDRLQVIYDARPLIDGGTCSRWAAMRLIDEGLTAAQERRELARARPATSSQIRALLNFGCNADHVQDLTAGEASDLVRQFTWEIENRRKNRVGRRPN